MNYYKNVCKRICTILFTIIGLFIIFKLAVFYIPFLIAFIISLLIEPIIRMVSKITNFTRRTSAIITLLFFFTIIISLLILGITVLLSEVDNIIAGFSLQGIQDKAFNLINRIDLNKIKISQQVQNIIQNNFIDVTNKAMQILKNNLNNILLYIKNIPRIMIYIAITVVATYFVCADKIYILDQFEHHLPQNWVNKMGVHVRKIITSLGDFLKAEVILILISFIIVLIGLYIFKFIGLKIEYPFLMALGIGFVDALPILGSGTVIVPWAIISGLNGDLKLGISLLVLYTVTVVVKQLLEPKIVSNHIGIHPIFTLIAMYTGFKVLGIIGMILGPITLIILKNIFEELLNKGIMKTILDRK